MIRINKPCWRVKQCAPAALKNLSRLWLRKLAELRLLLRVRPKNVLVFVNNDSPDRQLAQEVTKLLLQEGVGYSMRLATGSPERDPNRPRGEPTHVRRSAPHLWRNYSKLGAQPAQTGTKDHKPARTAVICNGGVRRSPPEKVGLDLMLPNLLQLGCRSGVNPCNGTKVCRGLRA